MAGVLNIDKAVRRIPSCGSIAGHSNLFYLDVAHQALFCRQWFRIEMRTASARGQAPDGKHARHRVNHGLPTTPSPRRLSLFRPNVTRVLRRNESGYVLTLFDRRRNLPKKLLVVPAGLSSCSSTPAILRAISRIASRAGLLGASATIGWPRSRADCTRR